MYISLFQKNIFIFVVKITNIYPLSEIKTNIRLIYLSFKRVQTLIEITQMKRKRKFVFWVKNKIFEYYYFKYYYWNILSVVLINHTGYDSVPGMRSKILEEKFCTFNNVYDVYFFFHFCIVAKWNWTFHVNRRIFNFDKIFFLFFYRNYTHGVYLWNQNRIFFTDIRRKITVFHHEHDKNVNFNHCICILHLGENFFHPSYFVSRWIIFLHLLIIELRNSLCFSTHIVNSTKNSICQ